MAGSRIRISTKVVKKKTMTMGHDFMGSSRGLTGHKCKECGRDTSRCVCSSERDGNPNDYTNGTHKDFHY